MDTHCSHTSALGRGTVQTGMGRHRSHVMARRSWHGSSSKNTRACESRRRVVVFSENQNRIVVNELGLGPRKRPLIPYVQCTAHHEPA